MVFLGVAILLFEIAYRKGQGNIAIYGIETLFIAVFTLFLPYIIFELDETYKKYYLLASIYMASYYILKSIYIAMSKKNKYMNNISDVKEIVKKEKTKRRVKEDIEEIEEISKDVNGNKEEKPKAKKRGRPKKVESKSREDEVKENKTPKKRGRPRKVVADND